MFAEIAGSTLDPCTCKPKVMSRSNVTSIPSDRGSGIGQGVGANYHGGSEEGAAEGGDEAHAPPPQPTHHT